MTNADHIRAMTDEELAEFVMDDMCPQSRQPEKSRCRSCKECWLEWLKQPHEEEEE